MNVAQMSPASGLIFIALLGPACDSAPPPQVKAEPVAEAKAEPVVEAKAEPAAPVFTPPVPEAPGPAYFAVDKVGIVRLDDGKFELLTDEPISRVKGLQIGGDGRVWASSPMNLMRLEGDRFKDVISANYGDLGGSIEEFVVAADGQIWARTLDAVAHYDGKAWSTEDRAAIGAGTDLMDGIAVDASGKVWVTSTHKVHVRDGGAWREFDLGKTRGLRYYTDVERGRDGSIDVLSSDTLFHVGPQPDKIETIKPGRGSTYYSSISTSTNGGLALVDQTKVLTLPVGGKGRLYNPSGSKNLNEGKIYAMTPDDRGRVWVSTAAGVAILGPDETRTDWPTGSVPTLPGEVHGLLVVGAGPTQLSGTGAIATGGLKGKLLRAGSPLADTNIEICPTPSMLYHKTPCSGGGSLFYTAKSDASGAWAVSDVPLGNYGLAVQIGSEWKISFFGKLGAMKAGEVLDTGVHILDDQK